VEKMSAKRGKSAALRLRDGIRDWIIDLVRFSFSLSLERRLPDAIPRAARSGVEAKKTAHGNKAVLLRRRAQRAGKCARLNS